MRVAVALAASLALTACDTGDRQRDDIRDIAAAHYQRDNPVGHFQMVATREGVMVLDTQLGNVSHCMLVNAEVVCSDKVPAAQ